MIGGLKKFYHKNNKKEKDIDNSFFKRDDGKKTSSNDGKKIENHRKILKELCESFLSETSSYEPKNSINKINEFLEQKEKMERIFYSEISGFIFNLLPVERGNFNTNIDKLLYLLCNPSNNLFDDIVEENKNDITKIVIKFFDHTHLAIYQIENAQNIIASTMFEAKEELKKEIKGMEKEYISILGIFAAIVLAFVGGITFSTSILENIDKASIYRIIFITSSLALILLNIFYILIYFLISINGIKKENTLPQRIYTSTSRLFILIIMLDILSWVINLKLYQRKEVISWLFNLIN